MKNIDRIGSSLCIAVLAMMASATVVHGQGRSQLVNECSNDASCLPKVTSVLAVLVVDATDSGIDGIAVEIVRPGATPRASVTVATLRTDKNGLAVGTMTAADRYQLRINAPGYFPYESDIRVAEGSSTKIVTIQLRVPPIHQGR